MNMYLLQLRSLFTFSINLIKQFSKSKPISKHFTEENRAEEMVSIVNEAGDTHNIISCSKNIGENRTKYSKFS